MGWLLVHLERQEPRWALLASEEVCWMLVERAVLWEATEWGFRCAFCLPPW